MSELIAYGSNRVSAIGEFHSFGFKPGLIRGSNLLSLDGTRE
jgi:hypothetical protein